MIEHSTLETAALQTSPGAKMLVDSYRDCQRHFEGIVDLEREFREARNPYSRRAAQVMLECLRAASREKAKEMALVERLIKRHLL
jgi:hypothetical protein